MRNFPDDLAYHIAGVLDRIHEETPYDAPEQSVTRSGEISLGYGFRRFGCHRTHPTIMSLTSVSVEEEQNSERETRNPKRVENCHRSSIGITSRAINSRVRRTSGRGTPPKLTMQITCVTPIF